MERIFFVSEPFSVLVRPIPKALITPKNYLRVISQPAWPFRTVRMLLRLAGAGRGQPDFIAALVPGPDKRSADNSLAEFRSNIPLYEHVKNGMDAVLELTQAGPRAGCRWLRRKLYTYRSAASGPLRL